MCGICGIIDLKRSQRIQDKAIIRNMANTLVHRGPDEESYYEGENISIGFRRLSIIGLQNGRQPITNEDESLVLVCNGEIFNYIELREYLKTKGHKFKTDSDVEVILHLYEEKGISVL